MPLKLFRATVANAEIHCKAKISPYIIWYVSLDHMMVKFEQIRMVETTQNFELFDKKRMGVLRYFWQNFDAILEAVWVEKIF